LPCGCRRQVAQYAEQGNHHMWSEQIVSCIGSIGTNLNCISMIHATQHFKHVLIGLIISGGKYEIIIVGVKFLPDDGAFVRTGNLHLDDLVATHHLQTEVATVFVQLDRKSTRLNSSHVKISYAVFCLKKK